MGNAYALKGDKGTTSLIADQSNFKDRVKQIKGTNDLFGLRYIFRNGLCR